MERKKIRSMYEYKKRYFPRTIEEEAEAELQEVPEIWGKFCAKKIFNPNLTAEEFLREVRTDPKYVFKLLQRKWKKPKKRGVVVIQPRTGRQFF